jgi:hypothetical protein
LTDALGSFFFSFTFVFSFLSGVSPSSSSSSSSSAASSVCSGNIIPNYSKISFNEYFLSWLKPNINK